MMRVIKSPQKPGHYLDNKLTLHTNKGTGMHIGDVCD